MELYVKVVATYVVVVQVAYALGWLTVRWWRTNVGKAHFFKSWALAAVLAVLVVGWWWSVPDAVWVALVTALAIGVTWQTAVFWRERVGHQP